MTTETTRRTSAPAKWDRIVEEIKIREARRAGAQPVREPRSATPKTTRVASPPAVTEAELAGAFTSLGHEGEAAKIAARGRGARPGKASSLGEAGRGLGMSPAAAAAFARGRSGISEAAKDAAGLPASAYAWTPDPEDPVTWRLQIAKDADQPGAFDRELVKYAVNQLPGIALPSQAIDIPDSDLPAVRSTLRSAWIACGLPVNEMPTLLNQEAIRRAFVGLGLTEKAAAVAASGRTSRRR